MTTLENICLKKMMLEYLRTGEDCYKKVIDYVNGGCKGDLDLPYKKITSLPEGLTVGGSLHLSNTPITSLPEGLRVDGYLNLYNTPISKKYTAQQLKQMSPNVKGRIF